VGTWGTGIMDNDTSCEVYADYISLQQTLPKEKAMERMLTFYTGKINSYEESNNFWFAIALAQSETNSLQGDVFERVKKIIETGADIALWRELKATAEDIHTRTLELADFLMKLEKQHFNP
jgi:hypothetical protein